MKYNFEVREISDVQALNMIQKYHYSNTLPKLNKHFLGFYWGGHLVGVITLGWGTRPLHTIQKLFPSLSTSNYYEIGRMCMTEEMPRNSESQMISKMLKWVKANCPEIKLILTWADGIKGKVGFVYQASNFIYTGKIEGELYIKDGVKIHVRQMKQLLIPFGVHDKRLTVRPSMEQMRKNGIKHYKGYQFQYIYFICDKKEKARLLGECKIELNLPRPKDKDLSWKVKDLATGKWVNCEMPEYKSDFDKSTKSGVFQGYRQMTLFDFMTD